MNAPNEGTPQLRQMLIDKGFDDSFARGVELWKMLKQTQDLARAISLEIDYNARSPA